MSALKSHPGEYLVYARADSSAWGSRWTEISNVFRLKTVILFFGKCCFVCFLFFSWKDFPD